MNGDLYVPTVIISDRRVTPKAFVLFLHILSACDKMGFCEKSQTDLGALVKVGDCQTRRLLKALEKAGYIEVTRSPGDVNSYKVCQQHIHNPESKQRGYQ